MLHDSVAWWLNKSTTQGGVANGHPSLSCEFVMPLLFHELIMTNELILIVVKTNDIHTCCKI
jgi:hypothetical protein